jgi:hypothetical protein
MLVTEGSFAGRAGVFDGGATEAASTTAAVGEAVDDAILLG